LVIVYARPDVESVENVFRTTKFLNNGAADDVSSSLHFIFNPSEGLCAIVFDVSDVTPTVKGVPVVGTTWEEFEQYNILQPEPDKSLTEQLESQYGVFRGFGLGFSKIDGADQVASKAVVFSRFFADEVCWSPPSPSKKAKVQFAQLIEEPEIAAFARPTYKLHKITQRSEEFPILCLYDLSDEDDEDDQVWIEGDSCLACLAVFETFSIWRRLPTPESTVFEYFVREGEPAPSQRPARRMSLATPTPDKEFPRDGQGGFLAKVFSSARVRFGLDAAKGVCGIANKKSRALHTNKKGGWPDWIQCDETPTCSACRSTSSMDLVVQIASDSSWSIEDSGSVYLFQCSKHPAVLRVVIQSL
jgi:hypothetical protein